MAVAKKVVKKRKELKNVDKGQVHIQSSFNNTIVTVTDARFRGNSYFRRIPHPPQRMPSAETP